MENFDQAAELYDNQFTNTQVGIAQREQVWKAISKLNISKSAKVLEINCGTGEDARRWQEQGNEILATDISPQMLAIAKQKSSLIQFQQLDIKCIDQLEGKYDIVFSNFGGLNCLNSDELASFFQQARNKLNNNGTLILVIMGKKCFWDKCFLILKGKWKERNRRNTSKALEVNVDGTNVKTWYYTPKEIQHLAGKNYQTTYLKPIGLFVPPSYLANYFEKKKGLLNFLRFLDKFLSFRFLSNRADHYIISLKKKDIE